MSEEKENDEEIKLVARLFANDLKEQVKSPCSWAFIEIRRFLVFYIFGVDCNYTDVHYQNKGLGYLNIYNIHKC